MFDLSPQALAVRAAVLLASALIGFGGGWAVNGWRLGAEVARTKQEHAQAVAKGLAEAVAQRDEAIAARDVLAASLARADAAWAAELRRQANESDKLRAAAVAGALRVRVRDAECPAPHDVPQAPAGRSVDIGGGAELTPQGRQDFLDLRESASRVDVKLSACQDALRRVTGSPD